MLKAKTFLKLSNTIVNLRHVVLITRTSEPEYFSVHYSQAYDRKVQRFYKSKDSVDYKTMERFFHDIEHTYN